MPDSVSILGQIIRNFTCKASRAVFTPERHQLSHTRMATRNSALPGPLSAVDTTSYAYKTVQHRMPIILTHVVDHLSRHKSEVYVGKEPVTPTLCKNGRAQETWNYQRLESEEELKHILGALAKLRNELQTNKPITQFDLSLAAKDSALMGDFAEWNSAAQSSLARNLISLSDQPKWFESSWLFVECYMYRRIMAAIHATTHLKLLDPFKWQKAESLKDATESVHNMLDYLSSSLESIAQDCETPESELKNHFDRLMRLSLWGNRGDLSHNAGKTPDPATTPSPRHDIHAEQDKMQASLILDDSSLIWEHLLTLKKTSPKSSPVRVDIITDNYGLELIADLILGEFLLISGLAGQIVYHVKAMPWFVSDTTVPDFLRILEVINDHPGKFGDKWRNYLLNGKFIATTDPFWTLPYDFDGMPGKAPELYGYFRGSCLLVLKGDLNYRKVTGDLAWPCTTELRTAVRGFRPAPLCLVRTCKAEVVVGLREGQEEELNRVAEDWMTSGEFAVIQFLKGEGKS